MIEFDTEARRLLDKYLGRVRSALRGCRSIDPADVERDIMDHIENELAEASQPVVARALDPVLVKLGSPPRPELRRRGRRQHLFSRNIAVDRPLWTKLF